MSEKINWTGFPEQPINTTAAALAVLSAEFPGRSISVQESLHAGTTFAGVLASYSIFIYRKSESLVESTQIAVYTTGLTLDEAIGKARDATKQLEIAAAVSFAGVECVGT